MKKRKSYAEVEPVKKKKKEKLCLERFCHYYNKKETKRKTPKTYIPASHLFKKKVKEGQDYMFCQVFGQLPN